MYFYKNQDFYIHFYNRKNNIQESKETLTKNSGEVTVKNVKLKKKLLSRAVRVALSLVSSAFVIGSAAAPAVASDAAETAEAVISSDGVKEATNQALKVARSKPSLDIAAGITCVACLPTAGVAASPGLCVACGILIAKVIG